MLAQSKLAQLETASSGEITGDSGDFGENFPGYTWSISTDEVSSEALGEIAADLKRIDMKVSLNNDEYSYNIRTYRFFRE
jgi:general secretion pathway protein I